MQHIKRHQKEVQTQEKKEEAAEALTPGNRAARQQQQKPAQRAHTANPAQEKDQERDRDIDI